MQPSQDKGRSFWKRIAGNKEEFSAEHRAYNILSVITLFILYAVLPFNIALGLIPSALMVTALLISLSFFYYLSRVQRRFNASITAFAITSYLALFITYYYNAGLNGPTLFLFFLTFLLLIAFTPRKQHWIWICLHIASGATLIFAEKLDPELIENVYQNTEQRYLDIIISYSITLGLTYFAISYLRSNYEQEKDKTDEKEHSIIEQNKQLAQLNLEKDKLFSIIAHDLRSPINSIKAYLQMVSQQSLNADERAHIENELLHLTDRTSEMLSNILSWSKSQMESKEVRLKVLNIHRTLYNTIEVQKAIGASKGVKLHYTPNYKMAVVADADMLQLVIRNLISNAIKFTDAGGEVNVVVKEAAERCTITVKDNGIGITDELQKDIFSLNIQPTLGTMNEKGVGLGLALCKEYTELQNGSIWFESIANAGSIFNVALPLASKVETEKIIATQLDLP